MDETHEELTTPVEPQVRAAVMEKRLSALAERLLTWEGLAWLTLALSAVVTRFWNLGARVMSHDESLHVYYSWILSKGGGYIHNPMMHGPFLFEFTAFFDRIFGANDFTSRIVPALFGIAVVVGVPLLLRRWLGRWGALAAGLLFLVSPYILFYSRYNRHDIEEITWVLLATFAIFSYLHEREEAGGGSGGRWLVLLAVVEALMFSSMETSFFYLAIFTSFLGLKMLAQTGLHWKQMRQSAEFDLIVVLATLGAFFSAPISLLALNPLWQRLTGQPFVAVSLFNTYGIEWASGPSAPRIWGMMLTFWVLAAVVGIWWNARQWVKLMAVFLALTVVFFTTFLTNNQSGIGTGFIGSLGYWLSQQSVARGSQPWYYYFIVFPLYEYLPLLGGLAAGIYFLVRRRFFSGTPRAFVLFAIWWAFWIFTGLSAAGEKMPWLSTHITVPFILLTAWLCGDLLRRGLARNNDASFAGHLSAPALAVSLAPLALLFILTARTSFMVNYQNYDYTTEFVGYAHGAPGIKWTVQDIEKIASQTGQGKSMQVAFDSQVSWPMSWYFRDHPGFFGDQINRGAVENAPVIVAGSQDWDKVESFLGPNYNRYEVIRMWWPMEDYKNLTWARIRGALIDPKMRAAVWDILWRRDYTAYAALTNENLNPPAQWPLEDRMRIYIRKDVAAQVSGLALQPSQIADLKPKVDVYAGKRISVEPSQIVTPSGVNAPRNFAFAPDGTIYIADSGNSRILHTSPDGKTLAAWGSRTPDKQTPAAPGTFNEPWGIAVDGQGNVYVTDTWNHRVQKFDAQGKFLLEWGAAGLESAAVTNFWGPRGILVGPNGDVYVTDTGNRRVVAFDANGKYLFEFAKGADAQLNEPVGLASGPDQHIYVADTWNNRVAVFDLQGKYLLSFAVQAWDSSSVNNKPFIAVDSAGRVYVTDPENGRVVAFNAAGVPLATFGQSGGQGSASASTLNLPTGINISAQGLLWVADAGNNRLVAYPTLKP